jgi:cytochrome c-type biogenesis protein CcmH/NrfG
VRHRALEKAAHALREGAIPEAIEPLTAAVEVAPDGAEPHRLPGRAGPLAERYDEALDAFDHAIRLDPRDEPSRLARAEALIAGGRFGRGPITMRTIYRRTK